LEKANLTTRLGDRGVVQAAQKASSSSRFDLGYPRYDFWCIR